MVKREILNNFTSLISPEVLSIAIGGFDGIHLAHKKIINTLGTNGAILIIRKYPAILTNNNRGEFTDAKIVKLEFEDIKNMDCVEFHQLLTYLFPSLQSITVGYDFCYGKNRSCNLDTLKKSNYKVNIIPAIKHNGEAIHSFKIKKLLQEGNIKKANILLGHIYEINGTVINGQGLGSKELLATINLDVNDFLLPKNGVYITQTLVDNILYKSVTFIGLRESTDGNFAVETHIINQNIEIKDKKVTIYFCDFIRINKKFESLGKLKEQIEQDVLVAIGYNCAK